MENNRNILSRHHPANKKTAFWTAGLLAMAVALPVSALDVRIPQLELSTVGASTEDSFALSSSAIARIAFTGGPKFGGAIELGASADQLEDYLREGTPLPLSMGLLSFTAYRLGNLPLDISWFLGAGDAFCNGDSFSTWFEDAPAGSDYRGIQYFPNGINGDSTLQYDGIHRTSGTGLRVALNHSRNTLTAFYLYQDMDLARAENDGDGEIGAIDDLIMNSGFWSGDIRFLYNSNNVKFEAFTGVSFPMAGAGTWRGGLLAFISTGTGADFLLQAGIPRWDSNVAIDIDNFFFLFEPRIAMGPTSLHITLFYHPYWYRQQVTGDQAATDLNLRFTIGGIQRSLMEGGLETTILFRGQSGGEGPIGISINPFFSFLHSGVRWDLKAMVDPFMFSDITKVLSAYVGVRTAF